MNIPKWNIEAMTGYKPITSFYMDFSISDRFGLEAVKDTYERAFREWSFDYKCLTELVMVLNWKCWEHYYKGNEKLSELYEELYCKTDEYAVNNLKGGELTYYYKTTD